MTEELPIILCGLVANGPYPFDDNIETLCVGCGAAIVHRPHAPKGIYMCLDCGTTHVQQVRDEGEVPEFTVTKETMNDLETLGWKLDPLKVTN